MAQFPRVNSKIRALAATMANGIAEHPDIFPDGDAGAIQQAMEEFDTAGFALLSAQATAKNAAIGKARARDKLRATMKNQIRLARVDTTGKPGGMAYIGIADRRKASAIDPPRPPMALTIEFCGENALALRWEKPPFDTRRPVRIFIVQRRPADYSLPWQLAGISFENRYELTPSEIRDKDNSRSLYRIIATNDNGSSLPGNVVSLPA